MSTVEKQRWWALGATGFNLLGLIWLWLPLSQSVKLIESPTILLPITVIYSLSLVLPFALAPVLQWSAWRVASHWAIAWFSYSWLAILLPGVWHLQNTVAVIVGLLFGVVGVLCVDALPNHVLGIRIVWTLQSPIIWHKTNVLGGWLLVASGWLMIGFSYLNANLTPIPILIFIAIVIAVSTGYAYHLAHQHDPLA